MMAGLFPPKNGQIWNPQLLWQPIAMHTDETLDQVRNALSQTNFGTEMVLSIIGLFGNHEIVRHETQVKYSRGRVRYGG